MPRDSNVYLEDILRAAASVRSYVEGLSRDAFLRDAKTVDAVIRNLEINGEAVKQVPPDVRAKAPEIEWQKIAGLRDVLIHLFDRRPGHRLGRGGQQAALLGATDPRAAGRGVVPGLHASEVFRG